MATYRVNNKMSHEQIQKRLSAHNSKIIFEKGTYSIKKPFYLYSNTDIVLEKGAVLKRVAQCYVFQSSVTQNVTKYNGCHDITITGGQILNACSKESNIISLFHSKNITISNMTISKNCGNHALEINSSYNVIIDNVTFDGKEQEDGYEFREQIQIDKATKTALPIYSNANAKCYDGTCCKKIVIKNCTFKGGNIAIGTHTQLNNGNQHTNITIENCTAELDGVLGKYGAFVRLIGMSGVLIKGNKVSNAGRFVEITTPSKFYNNNSTTTTKPSSKVKGCDNIQIVNNTVTNPCKEFKNNGIYVTSKFDNIKHTNIVAKDNDMGTAKSNL